MPLSDNLQKRSLWRSQKITLRIMCWYKILENQYRGPRSFTPPYSQRHRGYVGGLAVSLLIIGYFSIDQGTVFSNLLALLQSVQKPCLVVDLPTFSSSSILVFSSLALISCVAIQIVWLKKKLGK